MKPVAASLLLCALCTLEANAQPVYRCGSEYTQSACPQGKVVDAADPRTAAQVADAQRVAADDRRRADEMQRERLAEEAQSRPVPVRAGPAPAKPVPVADAGSSKKNPKKRRSLKPIVTTRASATTSPGPARLSRH